MSEDLTPTENVEPPCQILYLQSSSGKVYRCYRTSEADKVIAGLQDKLQKESALLKETREWLIESQKMHKRCADNAIKIIRHQKYKRCLAMAKWCYDRWIRAYHANKLAETRFYVRWHKRWLKLAEHYKEEK